MSCNSYGNLTPIVEVGRLLKPVSQVRILPGAQGSATGQSIFLGLPGRGYPVAIRFAQVTGQRAALYGSSRARRFGIMLQLKTIA